MCNNARNYISILSTKLSRLSKILKYLDIYYQLIVSHISAADSLQLFTKSNHYNSDYFLEVNVMITITFGQNKNDYN